MWFQRRLRGRIPPPRQLLLLVSLGAITCVLGAVLVTRVQLLPDVVDLTSVLTFAGFGGLFATTAGAASRLSPDRLGRVAMLGQLVGAVVGIFVVVILATLG